MKKHRWFVITYKDKKTPEVIAGWRQALVFYYRKDAEKCYKDHGFKKPKYNIRIKYF